MINRANDILSGHERDLKKNRADYDSGSKTKSELVYAADRYLQAMSGIKDQPASGGQRQHIRDVFEQALCVPKT
jgi:hypothetical protein